MPGRFLPPLARHKFSAVRTEREGISFGSKLEAACFDRLTLLTQAGEIVGFLRQIPFHLPGGGKYVCDFLVFYSDGSVKSIEAKGYETPEYKTKIRLVKALYPWMVFELFKAGH